MVNANLYFVHKTRFGSGRKWQAGWDYSVYKDSGEGAKEIFRHETLESMAERLSDLPEIGMAEFVPGNHHGHGPRVSLAEGDLTQYGTVSDEELAELAVLIHKRLH